MNKQHHSERQRDREELDRVNGYANHLQTVLDNKEFFLGPQTPDEDIHAQFNSIFSQIKTWSTRVIHGSVEALRNEKDVLEKCKTVIPLCKDPSHVLQTIAAKKERRLFVRDWTAFVACKNILAISPSGNAKSIDVWLDEASAQSFLQLQQRLDSAGNEDAPNDSPR